MRMLCFHSCLAIAGKVKSVALHGGQVNGAPEELPNTLVAICFRLRASGTCVHRSKNQACGSDTELRAAVQRLIAPDSSGVL